MYDVSSPEQRSLDREGCLGGEARGFTCRPGRTARPLQGSGVARREPWAQRGHGDSACSPGLRTRPRPPSARSVLEPKRELGGGGAVDEADPRPSWGGRSGLLGRSLQGACAVEGSGKPAHAGETASHINRREQVYQPVPEPGTPRCGQCWRGGQVSGIGRLLFLQDPVLAVAPAGGAFLGGEITWVAPPQAGAFYALQPRCAQGPAAPQPLAAVCNAEPQARDRQMQCQQPRGPVRSWC